MGCGRKARAVLEAREYSVKPGGEPGRPWMVCGSRVVGSGSGCRPWVSAGTLLRERDWVVGTRRGTILDDSWGRVFQAEGKLMQRPWGRNVPRVLRSSEEGGE